MDFDRPKVIIIGAGISGLAVATQLIDQGSSVQVVEGRDRVGGRLRSVAVAGAAFDLGATWFWPGEHRVMKLAQDLGSEIFDQWLEGNAVAESGTTPVYQVQGNPLDVPSYRLTDGASDLAQRLADRLPTGVIQLNRAVTAASYNQKEVEVQTDRGPIKGDALVVAAAPSSVVPHLIAADTLSESAAAVAQMTPVWMGSSAKVVAVYETPFWRDDGLAGSAMSYVGPMQEMHDMSSVSGSPAAIFGFASSGDPNLTEKAVVDQLVRLFGSAAASPMAVHITDWGLDPFTVQTPNSARPRYDLYGSPELRAAHWGGRLYFCSTETATSSPGHIEGALQAAERTVKLLGQLSQR